jgi:hypothetical protein
VWYVTRATGLVAMVLLTGAVTFGMLNSVRFARPGWPRFLTSGLHRNLSLLALTFTVVHVITTVLDTYTSIGITAAVVPFSSDYRRLWLGLGTIAFDLMLAVTVTSLLRARIGYRAWRAVHWASYASWPVAIVHGLGTGTDGARGWVLALAAVCVGVVLLAGAWRLSYGWPDNARARLGAAAAAIVVLAAAIGWLRAGPLHPGWARRAGTPVALLAGSRSGSASRAEARSPSGAAGAGGAAAGRSEALPAVPFSAAVRGTLTEAGHPSAETVTIAVTGTSGVQLRILITGPAVSGGVRMTGSSVRLGPYAGHLVSLEGTKMVGVVSRGAGGPLTLTVDIARTASGVTGTLSVSPGGGFSGDSGE